MSSQDVIICLTGSENSDIFICLLNRSIQRDRCGKDCADPYQIQNREKAMRVLKSRLYELYSAQAHDAEAEARRAMVGSGDRSAKIRTYNFPQSRVTDHRIGLTLYKLEAFIDGDMDEMIDALILDERMKLLQGESE